MPGFKRFVCGSAATAVLACAPLVSAVAHGHGFGHEHGWGFGRGLVGAVVGLVTLPLVIASAVIEASLPEAPYPSDEPRGYAPAPGYYAAPQTYYAPPGAYYPRAPVYYAAPRAYYAPQGYYAPRAHYAPQGVAPRANFAPRAYNGGYGSYRSGGYAYPQR